jgi:predicted aspartyl protease
MRAFILALILAFLWIWSPVRADERYSPLAQMPMDISASGCPVIPAQVNGKGPYWFLLDTGATSTTIRPQLAAALGLPKMAAQISGLQSMGGTMSADLYRVESINYGPMEAKNVLAPMFTLPESRSHPLMGVAGIDILRGHAIEFDFVQRTIRLHQGFRGGRGWVRSPARFSKSGYAFVPFSVNGISGEGFLDTGATSTILSPAYAAALGHAAHGAGVSQGGFIGGVEGARIPLYATPKMKHALGPRAVPDRPALFADLPIFARLGPPNARVAILGADILHKHRFVVDYPGQAVWWHHD